jgi:hypothetical protein
MSQKLKNALDFLTEKELRRTQGFCYPIRARGSYEIVKLVEVGVDFKDLEINTLMGLAISATKLSTLIYIPNPILNWLDRSKDNRAKEFSVYDGILLIDEDYLNILRPSEMSEKDYKIIESGIKYGLNTNKKIDLLINDPNYREEVKYTMKKMLEICKRSSLKDKNEAKGKKTERIFNLAVGLCDLYLAEID